MRVRCAALVVASMVMACAPSAPVRTVAPAPQPASFSAPAIEAAPVLASAESSFLATLNRWRVAQSLGTVAVDARLTRAALLHARDMARSVGCNHASPNGWGYLERARAQGYPDPSGEVLACGIDDPQGAWDPLVSSAPHRAILAHRDHRHVGIAVAGGMWVVVFGRDKGPPR